MSYRANRIDPAAGVEVIPDPPSPGRRRNIALDVLSLPLVVAAPRRSIQVLGTRIPLHYDFRRWTWRTERCVELALGEHVLAGRDPARVLELGNVLPLAGLTGHVVVDKYETGKDVVNVDILDYSPDQRFDLGISISTLEHVGFDEHPQELDKAAKALARFAEMAEDLLVTIPVGYHTRLEEAFLAGPFDRIELLIKTGRRARWEPRPLEQRRQIRYAWPYANANGILVGSRGLTHSAS